VVAPIAGETKIWQYVTLMKRIYMIDCPGIVPPNKSDSDEELLLRGVVRIENVEHPAQYIDAILARCQARHIQRTYGLTNYADSTDFLEQLARKGGRLLKGGEIDEDGCAKMVINDFLRYGICLVFASTEVGTNFSQGQNTLVYSSTNARGC
jgi:nuclear GTP-binding protein